MATATKNTTTAAQAAVNDLPDRKLNIRIRKYAEMDTRRKALEREAAALKKELDALLSDLTGGRECVIDTGKCTFTLHYIDTATIDSARLKKELPDIAAAYTKAGHRKDISYAVK